METWTRALGLYSEALLLSPLGMGTKTQKQINTQIMNERKSSELKWSGSHECAQHIIHTCVDILFRLCGLGDASKGVKWG